MGFRNGAYATVWEVDRREKSTQIRCSISRKNLHTGQYVQSFAGYVGLVGEAQKTAERVNLKRGDRIKLLECDVTNSYDKEKKKETTFCNVYSFEKVDNRPGTSTPSAQGPYYAPAAATPDDDAELPF